MEKSICFIVLLLSAISAHGQSQIGFLSIDCGNSVNSSLLYRDPDTGITYTSEKPYIDTGINKNISSEYEYPNNPTLPLPLSDLRTFPQGNKNCYALPSDGKDSLNLIRASFLYGNYDGTNKLPEFDLYLDVNIWSSVKFRNASEIVIKEIISSAKSDTINICLINKGLGTPFISALELRPLNSSTYTTEFGTSASLVLFQRWDIGSTIGSGRYKDDIYDRIWSSYSAASTWNVVNTSLSVNVDENGYKAPQEVIQTAARPSNGSEPLELHWNTSDSDSQFYVYLYFAEVEKLEGNQSRKFNISWNVSSLFGPFTSRYLYAETISNTRALVGKEHRISVYKTEDSTLPPILNAAEIYLVRQLDVSPTFGDDVAAIMDIKRTYGISKNWVGDPCSPKNYSWEGLMCDYNDSIMPRIIFLNLTSSGLSGTIAASFAKLSLLESLDLSNNNLTGLVPDFLTELKSLKFLNLKSNQLSGSIPEALLKSSEDGLLTLSADDQNICSSGSCKKKKKNIIVPIVAPVASALVLFILLVIWKLRRTGKSGHSDEEGRHIPSKKRQFTYPEVLNITNNFQTIIGKGGFGTVYHGQMADGTQVAVKMLSVTSSQGPKEFQAEAELLMTVHHRNLVSFIGYCDDGNNMALIYEYMANGNLKDYLSDRNSHTLTWEMRLHIAIDAAQGLEYLHHGCKPPIIHRDVKSANILLNESLDSKIADFGLSKAFPSDNKSRVSLVNSANIPLNESLDSEIADSDTSNTFPSDNQSPVTSVMGTTGYLDPEYYSTQKLNEKSDVYSFGIVLLELITGQPAIIKTDEPIHIVHWVSPELERGNLKSVVDPRLNEDFDVNSVWKASEVAMACTTLTSSQRATMGFVLSELKQCLAMELSRGRGRTPGLREDIHTKTNYSPEVYSEENNSMTGPSAR